MTRRKIHGYLYITCLFMIAVAIPLSNYMMSMGGIFLFANWVLEGNWKEKWEMLKKNKLAIFLSALFFVFLIGFIRTDHISAGWNNLLSKLPLLYAPVIMASSAPLHKKEIRFILYAFLGSVLTASICSVIYLFIHPVHDIREISIFISHIRFSLCLDLGIVLALHDVFKEKENPLWLRIIFLVIAIWFTLYLFIAQTLTGIVLMLILAIAYLLYVWQQQHQNNSIKWVAYTIVIFLFLLSGYLLTVTCQYFHLKEPDSSIDRNIKTQQGNEYAFDAVSIIENGSRIGNYVCKNELQKAWQTKSHQTLNPITEATLIRFLNSKGLRKDAQSVYTLSDKEIQYIENNIANIDYTRKFGIKRSLYPIFFSFSLYQKSGEINQSTLLQRIELWKTSLEIIQRHPWLGVGIGDQKEEINRSLFQNNSAMKEKKDYGCHNQFLTCWLIGGIALLLYFIFTLAAPFFYSTNKLNFLYLSFFIIIVVSMLTEDTLETQAGITLYAFFNSFFLFIYGNSIKQPIITNIKK